MTFSDGLLDGVFEFPAPAKLDFIQSGSVAERISQALHDGVRDCDQLRIVGRRAESQIRPEIGPNQGQRISEGRPILDIPGRLSDGP